MCSSRQQWFIAGDNSLLCAQIMYKRFIRGLIHPVGSLEKANFSCCETQSRVTQTLFAIWNGFLCWLSNLLAWIFEWLYSCGCISYSHTCFRGRKKKCFRFITVINLTLSLGTISHTTFPPLTTLIYFRLQCVYFLFKYFYSIKYNVI